MRPCLAIPVYDHGDTLPALLDALAHLGLPCFIVDDGSDARTRRQLEDQERRHSWVRLHRHPYNRGKGAALRTAFRIAHQSGMSHVVQIDADGQHDPRDVPAFLSAAEQDPEAAILGDPVFDSSAPLVRLLGRKLSRAIVRLETLSPAVRDPLCGFRCLPLDAVVPVLERSALGNRMEFDPELIVRLIRSGTRVVNLPTRVIYPEGGRSHFRMVRDNLRIAWSYLRLAAGGTAAAARRAGRWLPPLSRPRRRCAEEAPRESDWLSMSERGSQVGLRFMVWCFHLFGRRASGVLLWPIVAYFFVGSAEARRASQDYLARVHRTRYGSAKPHPRPRLRDTFRHLHAFAEALLDRLSFWTGSYQNFEIQVTGSEEMRRYLEEGRGAILLASHLGSFDVLRVISRKVGVTLNVITYTGNAQKINRALKSVDPECGLRVIEVDLSSVRCAFEIRSCLERGEFVAMSADRLIPGGRRRISYANFLGERAPFPQAPFLIPILFDRPALMCLALCTGPRRYELSFETIVQRGRVAAEERSKRVQESVEMFAGRLEQHCLRHPLQWFNFYDFWRGDEVARD